MDDCSSLRLNTKHIYVFDFVRLFFLPKYYTVLRIIKSLYNQLEMRLTLRLPD